ncbi:hypothetical protein NDU88_009832 [Pleurodeles waltl]|uniref:Uncharacterized protein n=1 Tax=Pleurodeles waltl TaxID=8319 RepID=A0AAV7QWV8_PLEWA|nr:hypothetical protein NDU88_009832 [Pleurodeles waltl]
MYAGGDASCPEGPEPRARGPGPVWGCGGQGMRALCSPIPQTVKCDTFEVETTKRNAHDPSHDVFRGEGDSNQRA